MRYKKAVLAGERLLFSHDPAVKKDTDKDASGLNPRRRRRRMVQYVLVFVGCVVLVDALVGDKGVLQMMKKEQEYRALERRLAAAQAKNAHLSAEARRINSDPAAIEEIARRELGLIKKGEKVFIIRDAGPAGARPGGK